jgi:neuropeptide Y receptor
MFTTTPATGPLSARDANATNMSDYTTLETVLLATEGPMVNTTFDDQDIILTNEYLQILFSLLYSSILILGLFGNVLVCYVVFRNKAMQTVTNLFITNLALSDILLCILAVPFTPSYTFLGN